MKMFSNKFKEYAKINIDNLPDFPEISFIDSLVDKMRKDMEDMYCEFLTNNGYKIDKPYNIKQLEEIQKDLEKQDKFIDCLEYTEFSKNCEQAYHYIIPFFNSISNPLSEEDREFIIKKWKKENDKNK